MRGTWAQVRCNKSHLSTMETLASKNISANEDNFWHTSMCIGSWDRRHNYDIWYLTIKETLLQRSEHIYLCIYCSPITQFPRPILPCLAPLVGPTPTISNTKERSLRRCINLAKRTNGTEWSSKSFNLMLSFVGVERMTFRSRLDNFRASCGQKTKITGLSL